MCWPGWDVEGQDRGRGSLSDQQYKDIMACHAFMLTGQLVISCTFPIVPCKTTGNSYYGFCPVEVVEEDFKVKCKTFKVSCLVEQTHVWTNNNNYEYFAPQILLEQKFKFRTQKIIALVMLLYTIAVHAFTVIM